MVREAVVMVDLKFMTFDILEAAIMKQKKYLEKILQKMRKTEYRK